MCTMVYVCIYTSEPHLNPPLSTPTPTHRTCVRHLLRLAKAPDGDGRQHRLPLRLGQLLRHHRRADVGGRDPVDRHARGGRLPMCIRVGGGGETVAISTKPDVHSLSFHQRHVRVVGSSRLSSSTERPTDPHYHHDVLPIHRAQTHTDEPTTHRAMLKVRLLIAPLLAA